MIDYIPSKAVKKFMEVRNIQLADFEKASLIYNSDCDLESKRDLLKELMEQTQDEVLRQQIAEQFAEDEKTLQAFISSGSNAIYELQTFDDNGDEYTLKYFSDFEAVSEYAKDYIKQLPQYFHITKFKLCGSGEQFVDADDADKDTELGYCSFRPSGKMSHIESYEYKDRFEYDDNRFEFKYISFRNPFRSGDIVRDLTNDRFGVVAIGDENHEHLDKMARDGFLDFSDAKLTVEYFYDDGSFCHNHPYPWDLEYTYLQFRKAYSHENSVIEDILSSASSLLKGTGSIDGFQYFCENLSNLTKEELNRLKDEVESRHHDFVRSQEYEKVLSEYYTDELDKP